MLPQGLKPTLITGTIRSAESAAPPEIKLSAHRYRQFEELAHPRVHDFAVVSHHGFANDFILQVVLQLAVLHLVDKEISDVTGIHLTRMVRDAAGQIDGA